MAKIKKLTRSDTQKALDYKRKKAMPFVKKIAEKYGRSIVIWCIYQMRDYEKSLKRLEELKEETERLERKLTNK